MKTTFTPVADLIDAARAFAQDQSKTNKQLLATALRGIDEAGEQQVAYHADIEAARTKYADDDLEIDDEAFVSEADEGTWVSAWVWVPREDAGE